MHIHILNLDVHFERLKKSAIDQLELKRIGHKTLVVGIYRSDGNIFGGRF
jgi:hypothetical protein